MVRPSKLEVSVRLMDCTMAGSSPSSLKIASKESGEMDRLGTPPFLLRQKRFAIGQNRILCQPILI